jgi:hypothetical protein
MRWIIGLVVSALAVMLVGFEPSLSPAVSAQDTAQPQATAQTQTEAEQADSPEALTTYSGGALEGIRKAAQTSQSTTTSTDFLRVVNATASWFIPAFDSDLLNVGFSAECRLINSMVGGANQDWVELRALLAGPGAVFAMQPNDAGGMAFCSADGNAMHHANFAARVNGGFLGATYTVQIYFRVRNNAPLANALGVLTARLDDWKLELAAYN